MTNDTFSQNSNQGAQSQTTDDAANPPIVISPQAQAPRKPKVALSEGDFRVAHVQQLPHSRNGNPRWRLTVTCPVTNQAYVFTTKSDVSSPHFYSLNRVQVGEYVQLSYLETKRSGYVAHTWKSCPATFMGWMEQNLDVDDLDVMSEYGVYVGIRGLMHPPEACALYDRYKHADIGEVVLSEGLLKYVEDEGAMFNVETKLVWMVAEHYARDPALRRRMARRKPR